VKIRRRGRHASPSPVGQAAAKAGPVVIVAGAVIATGPQMALAATGPQAALSDTGSFAAIHSTGPAAVIPETAIVVKVTKASSEYTVKSGDTLYGIAGKRYGNGADWPTVYDANKQEIADPNLIFPGEKLTIPGHAGAVSIVSAPYMPKHSATTGPIPVPANGSVESVLEAVASSYGWTGVQWLALWRVENREAGFDLTATNPDSGAYGIAQFINGASEYFTYGGNPDTAEGQAVAMCNYIKQTYVTPAAAWQHELDFGWY
jgi:LysM repeat protein